MASMSPKPYFPSEVWTDVLRTFRDCTSQEDLTSLWTGVRPVCRLFKEEIEDIFRTEHLPKTWLHVNLGKCTAFLSLRDSGITVCESRFTLQRPNDDVKDFL